MSLLVREVRLTDFRNFRDRVVEPAEALMILVGHNAVGKTNTVVTVPRRAVRRQGSPATAA